MTLWEPPAISAILVTVNIGGLPMAVVVALLINPVGLVFWLALGLTIWFAVNRTDRERRRYLRAIHPKHPEIGRFFWIGLVVGALVSLVMVI